MLSATSLAESGIPALVPRRGQAQRPTDPHHEGLRAIAMATWPTGRPEPTAFRMVSGFEILEEWFSRATQSERNIVSRILLSVAGKSVFNDFDVIDDITVPAEFFVLTKVDLTVKIRIHNPSSFGVVYIGPADSAPGLVAAA